MRRAVPWCWDGGRWCAWETDSSGFWESWASKAEMPEESDSSEREIWPSWVFGERFRDTARWRSRSDSLMWSARRNSWAGLAVAIVAAAGGPGVSGA